MAYSPARSVYWLRDRRLVVRTRKYSRLDQWQAAMWRLSPALRSLAPEELEDVIAAAPQDGLPAPKRAARKAAPPALSERSIRGIIRSILAGYPEPVTTVYMSLSSSSRYSYVKTSQVDALKMVGLVEPAGKTSYGSVLWNVTSRGIEYAGGSRRFLTHEQSHEESGFLRALHEQGAVLLEPYKGAGRLHEIRQASGSIVMVRPAEFPGRDPV